MWCDGRTFTETNGNIVSAKADRAVNWDPNTEQININRNSFLFSDHLGARQQMHQKLSGRFSPQMSLGNSVRGIIHRPRTLTWMCSWGSALLHPAGKRPWVWAFSPTIIHHEISFVMSSAEYPNDALFASVPNQLKRQKSSMNAATKGLLFCSFKCKVGSLNPWQWRTAVIAKPPFLTQASCHTGLVDVKCGSWGI